MLAQAAWKDTRFNVAGEIVDVPRGSFCASQKTISTETLLTRQALRTFLKLLETEEMLRFRPGTKSHTSTTMITICNYSKYQDVQPSSNQAATKQQPIKEPLNKVTSKRVTTVTPKKTPVSIRHFQEWWDQFPHRNGRKEKRPEAEKKYKLAVASGVSEQTLIGAAISYASTDDVQRGYGRGPIPWLNQKGWNDESDPNYQQPAPAPDGRTSGPHDSTFSGFAAFANSGSNGGGPDQRQAEPFDYSSKPGMDSGPDSDNSQPILRVINPD